MTTDDEDPKYGYGAGGRPLWSKRDRDAEAIRRVLRQAGHQEFGERRGGFAVEGANASLDGDEPFLVACADEQLAAGGELARYTAVLQAAGYRVSADDHDPDNVLVVEPPAQV